MTIRPRKLRLGMVGGGIDSFIGSVHRVASRLDDRYEIKAGALSSDPIRALDSGLNIGLPKGRIYDNFTKMADSEASRTDGIEVVSIVTPNHLHLKAARAFMDRGIHVICDKPLSADIDEALNFVAFAQNARAHFFLTYNYSAYPMVRLMKNLIARGLLGKLRIINVEYIQGWLASDEVQTKQAQWRLDPAYAGLGGALGDIGTHAYHLATYVSGLKAQELSAELHSFGNGRTLDDNAHIHLRFQNDVAVSAWISQVATGTENGLRIRVVGTEGTLSFQQENPNQLLHYSLDQPLRVLTRGGVDSAQDIRIPAGHPEGFLEGFATLYRDIADAILGDDDVIELIPGLSDGLDGMAFIKAAVESNKANGMWVSLDDYR